MLQADRSCWRCCCHGLLLLRVDTHALPDPAFNISPLFARALHTPPDGLNTLLFSFAEIVYKTHGALPLGRPVRRHARPIYWDAVGVGLETAAGAVFQTPNSAIC